MQQTCGRLASSSSPRRHEASPALDWSQGEPQWQRATGVPAVLDRTSATAGTCGGVSRQVLLPYRVVEQPAAAGLGIFRGRPADDLPDPAKPRVGAMRFDRLHRIGLVEIAVSDDRAGQALGIGGSRKPGGLPDLFTRRDADLDVHRGVDRVSACVAPQVVDEVVFLDGRRVAEEAANSLGHQPRVATGLEIPEVVMGIDNVAHQASSTWLRTARSSKTVSSIAIRPAMQRQCVTPSMNIGLPVGAMPITSPS